MSVRLSHLLTLPGLGQADVVAGPGDVHISDVIVWEKAGVAAAVTRPDTLHPAPTRPGSAVGVMGAGPLTGWQLDAILRACAARRAAALLIGVDAGVDEGTCLLADRLGVAVVRCAELWAALLTMHVEVTAAPAQRRGALVANVTAAMSARGGDVTTVLGEAARVVGCGVGLVDTHGLVLAGPLHVGPDAAAHLSAACGAGVVAGTIARPGGGTWVVSRMKPDTPGLWVAAHVPAGGSERVDSVAAALGVVALACAVPLAEARAAAQRDMEGKMALLEEIARTAPQVPPGAAYRAAVLGWTLAGWHTAARLELPAGVGVAERRAALAARLAGMSPSPALVEVERGWVCLITWTRRPAEARVGAWAADLRAACADLPGPGQGPIRIGVGRTLQGSAGLRDSLGGAAAALLGDGPPGHLGQWTPAQVLISAVTTGPLQCEASRLLAPLLDADPALLTTLRVYLDHESQLVASAAALGVHRNTVASRMERIYALLDCDLSDPPTRLAVHVACHAQPAH